VTGAFIIRLLRRNQVPLPPEWTATRPGPAGPVPSTTFFTFNLVGHHRWAIPAGGGPTSVAAGDDGNPVEIIPEKAQWGYILDMFFSPEHHVFMLGYTSILASCHLKCRENGQTYGGGGLRPERRVYPSSTVTPRFLPFSQSSTRMLH